MDGLEWCRSIALLRILLIASARSGVGVYPTATEEGLSIGSWSIETLEMDQTDATISLSILAFSDNCPFLVVIFPCNS